MRNVTNQYPSGSLTPSRPSATKHMTRRAHSAGKLRKEVSISFEPQSHSNDDYVGYSPLSVSDFCVSPPSHKKRPMFGRTVIISRSENSHMNKTVGTTDMEPRRHLYKPTRPQALESDKIKKVRDHFTPQICQHCRLIETNISFGHRTLPMLLRYLRDGLASAATRVPPIGIQARHI